MKKPNWKKYCTQHNQHEYLVVRKRGNKWCIFKFPHTELLRDKVGVGNTKRQAWKSYAVEVYKEKRRRMVRPPPPPAPPSN